jgi:hypothetical protein
LPRSLQQPTRVISVTATWCQFSGRRFSRTPVPSALSVERTEPVRRFAYERFSASDRITGQADKSCIWWPGNLRTIIGIFLNLFSLLMVVLAQSFVKVCLQMSSVEHASRL